MRKSVRLRIAIATLALVAGGAVSWIALAGDGQSPKEPSQPLPQQGPAPDFELVNQNGQRMRLSDFRGRAVLMTFFYANCPDFCPVLNGNFKQVHDTLGDDTRAEVVLLSISFDSLADTPERLKEYARERGFDLPNWYFLTGTAEEIERVTNAYGIPVQQAEPQVHIHPDGSKHLHERDFGHMAQALLIDQQGEVRKAYLGAPQGEEEIFSPQLIAGDIRALVTAQ